MPDFQLDQLRTLVAVVDHGTLESAARALAITPSAVSQRLKALEASAGRVLLRRTKPVTTTESGDVVLRLAREMALLESDAGALLGATVLAEEGEGTAGGSPHPSPRVRVPIVANADSLATWMLPALAAMPERYGATFEVHRDDEAHSAELLRDGTVMAAVTSVDRAVQGCTVERLGRMRYRAMATPAFVERWFGAGVTPSALAVAPLVAFDRKDELQARYLRRRAGRIVEPPRTLIPASSEFLSAVALGLGWGMLPELQSAELERSGRVVPLDGDAGAIAVPLYWQRWRLASPLLDALTEVVVTAAREALR